jgi:hypothetical protein
LQQVAKLFSPDEVADYQKTIDDLNKALDELERKKAPGEDGPPGLPTDQDQRAALALAASLQPAALERGSIAAFSAIQGAARKDRLSELVAAAQAQTEEDRKANEHLASIDKKTAPVVPAAL